MTLGMIVRDRILAALFCGDPWQQLPDPNISLHTADPGSNGSWEVEGGRYSRQPARFERPNGLGTIALLPPGVTFDDMPYVTVAYAGVWAGNLFIKGTPLANGPQLIQQGHSFTLSAFGVGLA